MKIRSGCLILLLSAGIVFSGNLALSSLRAAQPEGSDKEVSKEEKEILESAKKLVAAFDKGDAEAISQAWLPEGDYITQEGHHFKGREAIQAAFKTFFAQSKGATLRMNVTSIRIVTPELAIIDGISEVIPEGGGAPDAARYHVVRVKKGGNWMIASVREAAYTPPSNFQKLQVVSWLIGDWVDDVKDGELARVSYHWTENENFIIGETEVALKEIPVSGATQWIGWDESKKQIRSWSFASNGGFGEATWSNEGKKWMIKVKSVLPDGTRMSATNVITIVDKDHLTWQSVNRMVNDKKVEDTSVIKMKRAE